MTLDELRRLSGVGQGVYSQPPSRPTAGSNISYTGTEKARIMRDQNIQPGTPEWFQLWFSLPYLTGERPVK
jgi:hypothetical protein